MTVYNDIKKSLVNKQTTGILSFDIEKAFDRIWQEGLIYKMIKLNIPDGLIHIIHSFIKNRTFRVKIGNDKSSAMDTPWGVAQGSALSPTLYNLYIHDIPCEFPGNTKITNYADDTLIYSISRKIESIDRNLSDSSKIIKAYYNKWKIGINTDKTTLTAFTRRRSKQTPDQPHLNDKTSIDWGVTMKYLGIHLDKRITLAEEIKHRCAKFDNALKLIYPFINKNTNTSPALKIHLYRTYLRPILTYAPALIVHSKKTHLRKLETKQNKCLRMMLGISWETHTSTRDVLRAAGVPSIEMFIKKLANQSNIKNSLSQNSLIRAL